MKDLYPDGTPGWSNGFLKRCDKVKKLNFCQRIMRWLRQVSKIKFLILLSFIFISGCDEFRENQLVRNQAVTFEEEISYRQRKEIELENKLKIANENIAKLEQQLECKKENE